MIERFILEALQKAVTAAITASGITMPVKMIGRNFEKPQTGPWLEVIQMRNNVIDEFWDTGKTYRGVLRLLYCSPLDDVGAYPLTDKAEAITSYFTKGMKLADPGNNVAVRVSEHPDFKDLIEEPPEMMLPVSIRYEFFKA